MKPLLPLAALALAVAACVEQAPPSMTQAQAESYCAPQAENYARRPIPVIEDGALQVGLRAETPDDFMVQDFYRRCVFSKSGQRPSARLQWRL